MSALSLFRAHKSPEGGWAAYALRRLTGQKPVVSHDDIDHTIDTARDEAIAVADKFIGDHGGALAAPVEAQVNAFLTGLAALAESHVPAA